MRVQKLAEMVGGWFVGNFVPHVLQSEHVEVAIKRYKAGDKEAAHVHRVATELTVCISGQFRMTPAYAPDRLGNPWLVCADEVITLEPGEAVAFEAVTDCVCCVVKLPSVKGDKYLL